MTSSAQAIPYWFELSSPDPVEAASFYRKLFGWDDGPQRHAGFDALTSGSSPIAGMRAVSGSAPGGWMVFVPVDDLVATLSAVADAGGAVEQLDTDADRLPELATCLDPHGARFVVCRPQARPGAKAGGHGTFCRAELLSLRREGSEAFYGAVFGWTVDPRPRSTYTYYDWMLGDDDIAGLMPLLQPSWPVDLPEQWMGYFQVDDCAAAARRVAELGGTVEVPRDRIPPGWVLVCRDPQGALFNVIEFAPPEVAT